VRALLAIAAAVLLLAGCGGPVTQSHDLLGIAASPWPLRNEALVVFIKPSAKGTQVSELAKAIGARRGVAAWQYCPQMTAARVRADLAVLTSGSDDPLAPRSLPPESALRSRRAFVVVARSGPIQLDLADWLSDSPFVSLVAYWTAWNGTESVVYGVTTPQASQGNEP